VSIIVGLCEPRRQTWIGSDTLVCAGNIKLTMGAKWIMREPWAIGIAGHLRTVNLAEANADQLLGELPGVYEFARRMRDLLKADGFHEDAEDRGPLEFGQTTMLAHPTGLWTLGSDFSFIRIPDGQLWAEGSGRELALGAGHALLTRDPGIRSEEAVQRAIEAAIHFDTASGGEVWIRRLVDADAAAAADPNG
jgi:ATP-dependent protease HslVU (ClpYQ) peptidase subunit